MAKGEDRETLFRKVRELVARSVVAAQHLHASEGSFWQFPRATPGRNGRDKPPRNAQSLIPEAAYPGPRL